MSFPVPFSSAMFNPLLFHLILL